MKWLYWHKTSPDLGGLDIFTWKQRLERVRHPEMGYNPQSSTWVFALEADVTGSWERVEELIENYDGVLLEYINFSDSKKRPLGEMRTALCRKHNPNIIIVGSWDSWTSNPAAVRRQFKNYGSAEWAGKAVERCDFIFTTSNAWESKSSGHPMMWNDIFKTDKFSCLLAPFDIEYLQQFYKPYEEREKYIISNCPVNYWVTMKQSAEVVKACLPDGWKAGLSRTRIRKTPPPFEKLGVMDWLDFVRLVGKSYLGVFNAVGGGLASTVGLGAVLKTPFAGSTTADYLVECFPDLVKDSKDIGGQANLCKRLINEPEFWREQSEKGLNIAREKYSFEGAKTRLYHELEKREIL